MSEEKDGMIQMALEGIHAGFPSPAQDYMSGVIDLNKELVKHPEATFYGRVVGDSMVDAGINEGDVLVIDKSIEPSEGDMCVCFVDGEFALKFVSFRDPFASEASGIMGTGASATRRGAVREIRKAPSSYNILGWRDIWLLPANKKYRPIHIQEGNDFSIWGVVTYVIHKTI
ncbi:MAG: translesion error-prone DNA polymerase V autoproteolytic subunit [Bacteroidales bacterium]|nr:translesion error-prone DNA polymerase V autoproteolytic subunit [Bacteroidales bacterium]